MTDQPVSNSSNPHIPPIIDFEASGLDMEMSYPISVGIATSDVNYYAIIKPKSDWTHWCVDAERIHKIPRYHLVEYGLPTAEVVKNIERLLPSNRTIFSDNPSWDGFWATRLGLTNFVIANVKDLAPPNNRRQLKRIAEAIRADGHFCHHRAIDDAITLRLAVIHLWGE
ncbi:hypothetical protein [Marinimicrobium sp. C2-29]|uniref:hypothetical protein n=1 Tax=Marinimicrobium sp. C2-29 TaxID=3139825 RepID=UPI0031393A28